MLLRIGIAMMTAALLLAVAVAFVVAHDEDPKPAGFTAAKGFRNIDGTPDPTPNFAGRHLRIAPTRTKKPTHFSPAASSADPVEHPKHVERRPSHKKLPISEKKWPRPSGRELTRASRPRSFSSGQGGALRLTIPDLRLYDVPVINSESEAALNRGVIHIPETSMPWDGKKRKNVYLAGHRIGYPGTGSRLLFYNLDKLAPGDPVILKDRSGRTYEYRVSEKFVVGPYADWVFDTVPGRDMVTLQTCTPIPTFNKRLIVRADRVTDAAVR